MRKVALTDLRRKPSASFSLLIALRLRAGKWPGINKSGPASPGHRKTMML
jgi:hypothetical protein